MIHVQIPGRKYYTFRHLVLDMNGTIALDGELLEGVTDRIQRLSDKLDITIITADTHGSASKLERYPWTKVHVVKKGGEGFQKAALVRELGCFRTIAIGNGSNDAAMLRESGLGICVLGAESTSLDAIMNSNLVVRDIKDALDLLLAPKRLIATLRK